MSVTYNIACKDCRKTLWVAQGSITYIYSGPEFPKFLKDHIGHHLEFCDSDAYEDYDDISDYKLDSDGKC